MVKPKADLTKSKCVLCTSSEVEVEDSNGWICCLSLSIVAISNATCLSRYSPTEHGPWRLFAKAQSLCMAHPLLMLAEPKTIGKYLGSREGGGYCV